MDPLRPMTRVIPWRPLRRSLAFASRQITLDRAMRVARRMAGRAEPPHAVLRAMTHGWGNGLWTASCDYLGAVWRHAARANGPILECGSGVTTLLLGVLASQHGVPVCSLEHHEEWRERVGSALDTYGLGDVDLVHAPLRDFGAYTWYDRESIDIPRGIQLVICDGPPGKTVGGRYGLLPEIRANMAPNCVVLLDDAGRKGEREVLDRWAREADVSIRMGEGGKSYAVVQFGSAADLS
jgi:hypothetical protein